MEASHGRVVVPVVVFAVGAVTQMAASARTGQGAEAVVVPVMTLVPVLVGLLIGWRAPDVPVGAALAWVGAAPVVVNALELWGESSLADRPLPGAELLYQVGLGAWVWNFAGFASLCLVFPNGLLPGRRWRAVAWSAVAIGVLVNAVVSHVRGMDPDGPGPGVVAQLLAWSTFAALLAALAACVLSLVVRYRRGDSVVRDQVRWLMLGAGSVPVLLGCGWIAEAYGASSNLAYSGFMLAMLFAVPASVAVAVLRHDLFDIDRLLGASLAWLLTTLASAAIFAATVFGVGELVAGRDRAVTGAFVAALLLLPLHRRIHDLVGRVVDRDRHIMETVLRDFVAAVRDGRAAPEQVEDVLRDVLDDPALRLLIRLPDEPGHVDLTGAAAVPGQTGDGSDPQAPDSPERVAVPLRTGDIDVGLIELGVSSARRLRRAADAARQARLAIEVSRLRLEVRASRARIVQAATDERRVLERDLHDGAQQQIVAAGMQLRSLQRRLPPERHGEIDAVVEALEATIAELRRLAHGVRPSRLDDGLPAALHALVTDAPVPVTLDIPDIQIPEVLATTVYFVIAEAYANALKHSRATAITITVAHDDQDDGMLRIEVADDGIGGAYGLTSVGDRIASLGGRTEVHSPAGGGTRIEVVIPDAHRGGR